MINIRNIYKKFKSDKDEKMVLNGVTCDIEAGEKVVIIGASGSGKSTLLRCMNLLETPTFGEVWFEGKLITPVDPYLHKEIISKSNTYKRLLAQYDEKDHNEDLFNEIIRYIKVNDLLNEKNEGKEYKLAMKEIYNENHIDVNISRQKMGMCFQHFNLFNNIVLRNFEFKWNYNIKQNISMSITIYNSKIM